MSVLTTEELERRIANLEAENRELRNANREIQPNVRELIATLNLIANCEVSDLALAYCKGIASATLAKHGGAA